MKCLTSGIVVDNHAIAENIYKAVITAPVIANQCLPGQFVNIYFPESIKIFPRPFSIAGIDNNAILLVYKVIGSQTTVMSGWKPGDSVKILGPLGNSFNYSGQKNEPILLAGGVGAAPLMFLRDRLYQEGIKPTFFLGARTKSQLPFLSDLKSELILTTDDGSTGSKGLITDKLLEYLQKNDNPVSVFACGPDPMMKTLKSMPFPENLSVYVSLEKTMACGLGLCQGCIVKNSSDNDHKHYSLVCKDGPIFNLDDVEFDD
ncbi:dihydroorotate dehydrogenase electron transfer subunit [bacterium]|nr:dihydroorotate dehydrogenase electron transfer subunit [bacterium]MBU1063247.1 dihydroorotate dehydrogenase electron transfer subunit [bacterium]MBU1633404.1 dihydroorotate dehydrogenase electron transfer subunit [bacterium]MBU1875309.1 dihydroorotate dehydrogenase electron transfer subunit [bacterium]